MVQTPKQQTPLKPARDPYAQHGKTLASSVSRLRGWIGTDPSRLPELVDELNALVAHRLRGHAYATAGADAQEAVKRAADLLLADGPIGPYTTVVAATRCGTALVQLATLQVGLGLIEAAGRSLASWDDLRDQLAAAGTTATLTPPVVVQALGSAARVRLTDSDVGPANAYADAASARLERSGLREDAEAGYLPIDTDRLVADCRWAAGRPEESLAVLQRAKHTYDTLVAGRLAEPGRHPPALVERLAEPLPGLGRDLADRLGAVGELDLALTTRRELVELMRGLAPRLGDPAQADLAAALTDLARDLLAEGRVEEAAVPAEEAVALGEEHHAPEPVRLLARAVRARAQGDPDGATILERQAGPGLDRVRGVVGRGETAVSWTPLEPWQAYADDEQPAAVPAVAVDPHEAAAERERERVEAHRRELERQEQARREAQAQAVAAAQAARVEAEQQAARRAAADEARRREAEEAAAAAEAEQQESRRRREQRLREHQEEVERREREQRDARREEIVRGLDELVVAVPTAAEEHDRERLQAELAALDEPETVAVPPEPEPEPKPEPEVPVLEPGPVPVTEAGPDELATAQEAYERAREQGGRREVRAASEALVTLLRPRAATDPAYVDRLRSALEDLAGLRLRGGDLFGSRAANKEARSLRRG